jgi:hypothetical protein
MEHVKIAKNPFGKFGYLKMEYTFPLLLERPISSNGRIRKMAKDEKDCTLYYYSKNICTIS